MLLKDSKRELTKLEFERHVAGVAKAFKEFGIEAGEYVALKMEHGMDYTLALFGLANLGAIPVLVPSRLKSFEFSVSMTITGLPSYSESKESLQDLSEREIILFTSGTSSKPKAAVLTFQNFLINAVSSNENIPFGYGDKWLMNLPLYHVGGLSIFFRAFVGSGCAYFSSLTDSNVTHVSMVYTQLYRYLQNPHQTYLKAVLLGGSTFPEKTILTALDQGLPVYRTYGMTEMASQITTTEKNKNLFSSGHILKDRELKIVNGEILVRGKTLFKGFLNQPSPFTEDGWYPTRDVGYFENENLIVTGRKDRMFICAGENIQPEVIEQALLNFPGITQTRVVAKSNPEYGFVPVAYIESETFKPEDVKNFIRSELSGLFAPHEILPYTELPIEFKSSKDL